MSKNTPAPADDTSDAETVEPTESTESMTEPRSLTIVVLAGGISHERDVSLRSGRRVAELLQRQGHRVRIMEPNSSLLTMSAEEAPDVFWPALHGASGEDGALQGILEARGAAFVGSAPASAALAWSKPTAKTLARRAGLSTPDWLALPMATFRELGAGEVLGEIVSGIGRAAVVKPSHGGSAQGVTIVAEAEELPRAMIDAYTYSDEAIIERKIVGTELAISIVDAGAQGPVALPPVEIEPHAGVYSFEARYNAGETTFFTPPRLDAATTERAMQAALDVHRALGLRHLSRIDLIVDEQGVPWFIDANMMPGLTETSLFPMAVAAAGRDEGALYSQLAHQAVSDAQASA